jgi:small subunit ribosomal protein S18
VGLLRNFLTERGRIVPRRISGNCLQHQRVLTVAVKRARQIALVSFAEER